MPFGVCDYQGDSDPYRSIGKGVVGMKSHKPLCCELWLCSCAPDGHEAGNGVNNALDSGQKPEILCADDPHPWMLPEEGCV